MQRHEFMGAWVLSSLFIVSGAWAQSAPVTVRKLPDRAIQVPTVPADTDCGNEEDDDCTANPLPLPMDMESRKAMIKKHLGRSSTAASDESSVTIDPDQAVVSGKVLRDGLWPVAGAEIYFHGMINDRLQLLPVNGAAEIKVVSEADGSYTAVIGNENYTAPDSVTLSVYADDHFVYIHDDVHDRNLERATPIPLGPGGRVDGLNAKPFGESSAIMLWGTIRNTDGQPVHSISVVSYIDGKNFQSLRFWDTSSGADGKFAILLPPSGQTATLELVDKSDEYESGPIDGRSWKLEGVSHYDLGTVVIERLPPESID